ncbi:MAG: hypothetical protein K0R38_3415 [Polyangiaceae bacterium]|jgi:hypothetical protein|nr:hypothetical protein [Polyangiaceae bacterium]
MADLATVAMLVATLLAGSAAAAEPPPPTLKVSGRASFSLEARSTGETFEVRATLSDEVGRPLPNAEVRLRASQPAGTPTLRRCGDPRSGSGAELSIATDKLGRVCVNAAGVSDGVVELSYQDARGYLERASASVRLPADVKAVLEVGFDPPLAVLPLDQPVQELGVVARALDGSAAPVGAELVLSLSADGQERELGRTALSGLAEVHRLTFVSGSFDRPGPARLLARLVSRSGQELARSTVPVLRSATVLLQVGPEALRGVEPGTTLPVRATFALGPAPVGVVEARSAGRSVAAAPITNGTASLNLPSAGAASLGGALTLEYVGAGPGWLSGPPLELRVLPAGPSYGRYALWILAAVFAALAVVLGWRRPPRPRPVPDAPPPRPRASVEVLESFGAEGGYQGFVRDAHEGFAISPAVVSFIGTGANRPVLFQARTSTEGTFRVETSSFPPGTQVEVTAPFHATLVAALPGPGVLQLSLISRRRALLERLVRWAERRGKPWTRALGEPTPAHIAEVAAQEAEPQVERWARGLEHLAYGPVPPDAASEQAAGVTDDPKVRLD